VYGRKLDPAPIPPRLTTAELVDRYFLAYNAGRLREACRLMAERVLRPEVTVGLSLSGAITPTGLGVAALAPLVEHGAVDWVVSTGANLYHDLHRSLGFELYGTRPDADDVELRRRKLIRIYDIVFDQAVLLDSDAFVRQVFRAPEFQRRMGTAELHHLLGRYVAERERQLGVAHKSFLTAAYQAEVPIYTSSPGDSTLGMNVAALALEGGALALDVERDVNETTAIVHEAKSREEGASAVLILGGGSPKNFVLQTEPQLQEILGISEKGHDYFIQITDARPDTGGLSGATPSEAVTWGKIDPDQLPDTVVCYCDSTIALPLLTAYLLETTPPRPLKRLYRRRQELLDNLERSYRRRRESGG
jgi:deoxyhypusine synthase